MTSTPGSESNQPIPDITPRLCDLSTQWSVILAARDRNQNTALDAQCALMERYVGAVYRYLLAVVRDSGTADDLVQEFALRFLRGGFKRLDPQRGRFRDYVKAALQNLLNDHFNRRSLKTEIHCSSSEVAAWPAESDHEKLFRQRWREELLDWAWRELQTAEVKSGTPYYTVLRKLAENPSIKATQIALELSRDSEFRYTDSGVRQLLHRARAQFSDLLVTEVERSLPDADADDVESELAELGLLAYCKDALQRRRDTGKPHNET